MLDNVRFYYNVKNVSSKNKTMWCTQTNIKAYNYQ